MKMENNKYTELDKFFKSRLNKAPETDWNTPPFSILDDALDQIAMQEPPKRRVGFLWFISGAVMLSVIVAVVYNIHRINHIQHDLTRLQSSKIQNVDESEINKLQHSDALKKYEESYANVVSPSEVISPKVVLTENYEAKGMTFNESKLERSLVNKKRISPVDKKNELNTQLSHALTKSDDLELTSRGISNSQLSSGQSLSQDDRSYVFIPLISTKNNQALPSQSIGSVHSKDSLISSDIQLNPVLDPNNDNDNKNNNPLSLFLTTGVLQSCIKMTNVTESSYSLTEYDQWNTGYFAGLGLLKRVNNQFTLSTALTYNRTNNNSLFQDNMNYNIDNMITQPDGSVLYESNIYVESPMATYNDKIALRLLDDQVANGEVLNNKTKIKETYHYLKLSANIGYELFNINKLRGAFSLDLGINYMIAANQSLNTQIYHWDDMIMTNLLENEIGSQVNRLHLSSMLRFGLDYSITDKMLLGVELGYEKGLSSMRQYSNSSLPKAYINSIRTGLRLGYSF